MATPRKKSSSSAAKSKVAQDAETIDISIEDLTPEDIEVIEQEAGMVFGELLPDGKMSARGIAAIAWFGLRKKNPGLRLADVMKRRIVELSSMVNETPARPTTPRG